MKLSFKLSIVCIIAFVILALGLPECVMAFSRGIYLTQSTAQNTKRMNNLMQRAKSRRIDTFIIDIKRPSKRYAQNIAAVEHNGIRYVARLVVFPHGGTDSQVKNKNIWKKRLRLAKYAERLGASAIQLDYIRYRARSYSSRQKARNIYDVVRYFKDNLRGVKLQADIFGVAAHQPSHTIGQDARVLASVVDALCPMVYPSHYEPHRYHGNRPYETVMNSIAALRSQLRNYPDVKIFAYIEVYNYRKPMSRQQKFKYIAAEIKGAKAGGANGWYAWSPRNKYGLLFQVLRK